MEPLRKQAGDGWIQEGPLLYRLTDERRPKNRDEIIVTMANSSRTEEARTRRAGELLDAIRAAAPQAVHPENIREGAPYDNPEFEQLARDMGVWGTAQSAVCAQFWLAATPAADAPVVLPEPVGWFHRHSKECKNGEVCNYRIAPADKKDGWEEFLLYTEQQVRALLATGGQAQEADAKDAARYRFLRDGEWRDTDLEPFIRLQLNTLWDAKIDAARKQGANHDNS